MLLLNYDLHDIHFILTMVRFMPAAPYNERIIESVLEVLTAPQTDDTIDDNIIRKKLRTVESLLKDDFPWVYVDNIYTYGIRIIKDDACYIILTNGFKKMLELVSLGELQRLKDLADALHNIPIIFAEGCEKIKKTAKNEFLYYNKTYKTNLFKELSN